VPPFTFGPTSLREGFWYYQTRDETWRWVPYDFWERNQNLYRNVACVRYNPVTLIPTGAPPGCDQPPLPPILTEPIKEQLKIIDLRDALRDLGETPELANVLAPLSRNPVELGPLVKSIKQWLDPTTGAMADLETDLLNQLRQSIPEALRGFLDLSPLDAAGLDLLGQMPGTVDLGQVRVIEKAIRDTAAQLLGYPIPDAPIEHTRRSRRPGIKLPGFNPTYPTDRDRWPAGLGDRESISYLYGYARGQYYRCPNIRELDEIKLDIPVGMEGLYATTIDQAFEDLGQVKRAITAKLEELDIDPDT